MRVTALSTDRNDAFGIKAIGTELAQRHREHACVFRRILLRKEQLSRLAQGCKRQKRPLAPDKSSDGFAFSTVFRRGSSNGQVPVNLHARNRHGTYV